MQKLAHLMDSSITLPGGFRIGIDGLIGLIPGVGDAIGLLVSSYLIGKAATLGASRLVLVRMIGNVLLETALGSIPVLGDVFDFVFKANNRNMKLLLDHQDDARLTKNRSIGWMIVFMTLLLGICALLLGLLWLVVSAVFRILF
ncbi:DUF4112 domain-containing protein [Granulosicoccus sp. 3-233]|uniref:DUF4112 domain-containing protein n=1 Tax=Granulosicoccus sp. 3-233 TaxID=3417969 RepID=UPI003D342B1C